MPNRLDTPPGTGRAKGIVQRRSRQGLGQSLAHFFAVIFDPGQLQSWRIDIFFVHREFLHRPVFVIEGQAGLRRRRCAFGLFHLGHGSHAQFQTSGLFIQGHGNRITARHWPLFWLSACAVAVKVLPIQ